MNFMQEAPSGDIDGSNNAFTLSYTPIAGTVSVYKNGNLVEPPHYTVISTTIVLDAAPLLTPPPGDTLWATYFY